MDWLLPGAQAILGGSTMPTTMHIQLHVGNPGSNGTANVATFSTRASFTWETPVDGETDNPILIQWFDAPAIETATHVTLWSAGSGGTGWFVHELDTPASIEVGNNINIEPGALTLTLPVWGL